VLGNKWESPSIRAFLSKSLNMVEWNYKIHNKEMLAIICALEERWHFLEGAWLKFEVWTDHRNLEYFPMAQKLNWWQAQWSILIPVWLLAPTTNTTDALRQ
jgi:hypothetical protein